jgi:hypothetical protein
VKKGGTLGVADAYAFACVLLGLLAGSCALLRHTPPVEPSHTEFSIPLTAKNTDTFCADTVHRIDRPCQTIGALRAWLLSVRATP